MLLALVAALAVGLLGAVAGARTAIGQGSQRPNIVVVMTDDQTVRQTRVMASTRRLLRDRGVSFTRAFASFPLCCPSRATFLTGQHSHNHGVLGNGTPIGGFDALDQQHTLGVWLQRAGYHTIQVGKFLNGYGLANPRYVPPGWDEWIAAPDRTTNRYFDYELNENGTIARYGGAPSDYKSDVYTQKAVERIRARTQLASPIAEPFFLFVGYTAPHLPAIAAHRDRDRFRGSPLPRPPSFNERDVSDKPRYIRRQRSLSGSRVRKIARQHRSQLRSLLAVDAGIARIIAELADQGLLDETYVFFISDNGFMSGEHRLPKGKYVPYEPSIRVPLIVRGPGLPSGARSEELVSNVDLAPTILDLADAPATVTVDGRSLLPFATNTGRRSDRPIFLEANTIDDPSPGIPYAGLRTRRFKFVRYRSGELELYDLARDPHELASRHRDRRYRATRATLARALARYRDCAGAGCRAPLGSIPGPR
jgi:N-acetylglucosamine-6-sulfatase